MRNWLFLLGFVASSCGVLAAAEHHTSHPWLLFSAGDEAPPDLDGLALPDERRDRLLSEGWGFVDVLWRTEFTIAADGKVRQRQVHARHFLDSSGVQSAGNLGVTANATTDRLILERAFVLLPGGAWRECDPSRAEVVTSQPTTIFADQFDVVLPFEGLVPGATAVLVTTHVTDTTQWPLPWSWILGSRWFHPLERIEVTARWSRPQDRPTWATNDDRMQCASPSENELRCVAGPADPLKTDPELRSAWDVIPQAVLAEPHSWSSLAQRELALLQNSIADSGPLESVSRELARSTKDENERLDHIHRFVADDIRYLAREHGTAAVVPAPVGQTLVRRYGDCKGKVALFVAMAERLGIRAWPVLVATDRFSVEGLVAPSWKYFDHMIVCAQIDSAEAPVCMDLTTPNAATGQLPPWLYGAVALELRADAEAPSTLPSPESVWQIDLAARNHIDCDGTLTEELERTFLGPAAITYRDLLRGVTDEDRHRWAMEDYRELISEGSEPIFTFGGVASTDQDVEIASTTTYPALIRDWTADYWEPEVWLEHYARMFETRNLHHPYHQPGVRIRSTVSYQLCDDLEVGFTGPELGFQAEFGSLTRSYRQRPSELEVVTVLELVRRKIEPPDLERYQRFLDQTLGQTMISFSFRSKKEG